MAACRVALHIMFGGRLSVTKEAAIPLLLMTCIGPGNGAYYGIQIEDIVVSKM